MDVKYQKPATGVFQIGDFGTSKMYKAVCVCGTDDCTHTIDIEADDGGVTVIVYTKQRTDFWGKSRWHHIWKLLTTGHISYESSIIMDEQMAINYAETIKKAIANVKEFRSRSGSNQ